MFILRLYIYRQMKIEVKNYSVVLEAILINI